MRNYQEIATKAQEGAEKYPERIRQQMFFEVEKFLIDLDAHQSQVRDNLGEIISRLLARGHVHDASKEKLDEVALFVDAIMLKRAHGLEGKDEGNYFAEAAIKHYESNDHHPEHFEDGISAMSILQIIEMLADWKSASAMRGKGVIELAKLSDRFKISDGVHVLIENTLKELGWKYE